MIFVVPADNGVTNPVVGFTVATPGLLLLQVPPAVPLEVYVAVDPIQSGVVPLTVPGLPILVFTVKVWKADCGPPHPDTV